jgi:probable non-F420 flavinoid oxidoreductase
LAVIGYHASHEQFSPSELLRYVQLAESAGFQGAMSSDHLAPWSARQGHSGFAWSWLGAALHATGLSIGVVNAPGVRYHPAIVAQAAATLAEMFPGRFWLALGSGQLLNEGVMGQHWPPKPERNARLREAVDVMRRLWAGDTVTHHGAFDVVEGRIWTRPDTAPLIVGAALSPETARFAGGWADALITVNAPRDHLERLIDAFRAGGGDGRPLFLQAHLSYAASDAEAEANAFDQWRSTILPGSVAEEIRTPDHFDAATRFVRPADVHGPVRISSDPERHLEWIRRDLEMGFERVFLHNVGRNQPEFIEAFGRKVVPNLS